jgi:PAS domain S-box-containing protein
MRRNPSRPSRGAPIDTNQGRLQASQPRGGPDIQAGGGRRRGLLAHLVALVFAVLLPVLALGGVTAWHMAQNYRRAFEDRLSDTARALAIALDAELGAHLSALRALASSPDLDPGGDLGAFRRLAEPALGGFGSWVVVTDVDRRAQVANTRLPPDAPLPPPDPAASQPSPMIDHAIATGEAVVMNLYRGPVAGRLMPAVVVPVVRDGRVVRLLAAPVLPERLSAILVAQGVSGDGFATLADGFGHVVARSAAIERHLGSPLPAWFGPATEGRARGLATGPALDGRDALIAFQRLDSAPSWTLSLGVPSAAHRASWMRPLLVLGAGGAAALALALAIAAWLARRMLHPVRALVRQADALAAGAPPPAGRPSGIAEFEALRDAAARADTVLRRAAAELRESEARFRAVFESSLLGLSIHDTTTGETLAVNDRALALADCTREEFARGGRAATSPGHPDRAASLLRPILAQGGGDPIETHHLRRDGTRVPLRLGLAALPGQPGRVVLGIEDLAERQAAEGALRESEARLRLAQDAAGIGSWEWNVETGALHWSESCHRLHGTDPSVPPSYAGWRDGIHPEDWPQVEGALQAALAGGGTGWTTEFRFTRRSDGALRWISGRGSILRDAATGAPRRVLGVALDITERRIAEERQSLLMREVDHRAKNALAVVQAALRLTRRDDVAAYAAAVEGRVSALARAQSLLAEGRWNGADLRTLLQGELAPFVAGQAVAIDGPAVVLPPGTAQPLAMAVHELATNAVKHGALSVPQGRVAIAWHVEAGMLRLRWTEAGGPAPAGPPARPGFGSRVLDGTIRRQLGGAVALGWPPSGLVCGLAVPLGAAAEPGTREGPAGLA